VSKQWGVVYKAFNFNGVDNYININRTLGNFGTSDFTISLWINSTQTNDYSGIFCKRDSPSYGNFFLLGWNKNNVGFELNQTNSSDYFVTPSVIIQLNNWYCISLIRRSNQVSIFINGNLGSSKSSTTIHNITNTAFLRIGGAYFGDNWYCFKGLLDDIRIYNRALTEPEIQQLYNE
jgi:hypothetical protein